MFLVSILSQFLILEIPFPKGLGLWALAKQLCCSLFCPCSSATDWWSGRVLHALNCKIRPAQHICKADPSSVRQHCPSSHCGCVQMQMSLTWLKRSITFRPCRLALQWKRISKCKFGYSLRTTWLYALCPMRNPPVHTVTWLHYAVPRSTWKNWKRTLAVLSLQLLPCSSHCPNSFRKSKQTPLRRPSPGAKTSSYIKQSPRILCAVGRNTKQRLMKRHNKRLLSY